MLQFLTQLYKAIKKEFAMRLKDFGADCHEGQLFVERILFCVPKNYVMRFLCADYLTWTEQLQRQAGFFHKFILKGPCQHRNYSELIYPNVDYEHRLFSSFTHREQRVLHRSFNRGCSSPTAQVNDNKSPFQAALETPVLMKNRSHSVLPSSSGVLSRSYLGQTVPGGAESCEGSEDSIHIATYVFWNRGYEAWRQVEDNVEFIRQTNHLFESAYKSVYGAKDGPCLPTLCLQEGFYAQYTSCFYFLDTMDKNNVLAHDFSTLGQCGLHQLIRGIEGRQQESMVAPSVEQRRASSHSFFMHGSLPLARPPSSS